MATYQTGYGNFSYFSFEEKQADGSYRVYITEKPGYGKRETKCSVICRLPDGKR